jgi:transcriptional regulator with XRE-family HTH domain
MDTTVTLRAPDKEWFLEQLSRRELTQQKLAERMKVDPATISYTVNGQRKLNLYELSQLSDILQLPTAEIMHRWGYPVKQDIPVVQLKWYLRDDCELHPAHEPFATIASPPGLALDGYAVQVRTASAVGSLWNGMVCFMPGGKFSTNDAIGHLAIVHSAEGRSFMGVLSKGYSKDLYNVTHPAHAFFVEDIHVTDATPVAWFRPA